MNNINSLIDQNPEDQDLPKEAKPLRSSSIKSQKRKQKGVSLEAGQGGMKLERNVINTSLTSKKEVTINNISQN